MSQATTSFSLSRPNAKHETADASEALSYPELLSLDSDLFQSSQDLTLIDNFSERQHDETADTEKDDDPNCSITTNEVNGFGDLRSRIQRLQLWVNRKWAYEIFSCVINLIACVLLLVYLYSSNYQPSAEGPHAITINLVVALLTTLMRGTAMFTVSRCLSQLKWNLFVDVQRLSDFDQIDSASRGPWGSFLILFGTRKHGLIYIGAIITIITFALGPIAQQLVTYEVCYRTDPPRISQAFIPRIGTFNTSAATQQDVPDLEARLLFSLKNDGTLIDILKPDCITGNCTFGGPNGSFQNLAMEYGCTDVSSRISSVPSSESLKIGVQYRINGSSNLDTLGTSSPYLDSTIVLRSFNSKKEHGQPGWTEWPDSWIQFTTLMYNNGPIPVAFQCTFWPSVRTVNATIVSGTLKENVLRTEALTVVGSNHLMLDFPQYAHYSSASLQRGVSSPCYNSTTPGSGQIIAINNTDSRIYDWHHDDRYSNGSTLNISYADPACVFYIPYGTLSGFSRIADSIFTGSVNMSVNPHLSIHGPFNDTLP
ncbi:hypothetical protein K461DRAFT_297855 [Myriangium duriaei CBS 260.36]|uniref:Uncharacterized protein n=1 Tax=Myriangium duriaei CBS 260.36 TaxID=1168546 RepID=A0A9P4IV52_9PEZI|nr:hypothetical protein K461DRAFT_297855 [Myriangium duriaei CBS 260.36]